jgi:hypothetical protein
MASELRALADTAGPNEQDFPALGSASEQVSLSGALRALEGASVRLLGVLLPEDESISAWAALAKGAWSARRAEELALSSQQLRALALVIEEATARRAVRRMPPWRPLSPPSRLASIVWFVQMAGPVAAGDADVSMADSLDVAAALDLGSQATWYGTCVAPEVRARLLAVRKMQEVALVEPLALLQNPFLRHAFLVALHW